MVIPFFERNSFEEGALIVKQDDPGDRFYFITHGSAEVLKESKDPHGKVFHDRLAVMRKGDTFGEMGLIDVEKRSASVRALEPVETYSLTNIGMYHLYQQYPELYTRMLLNLARDLSRRIRKLDTLYTSALHY